MEERLAQPVQRSSWHWMSVTVCYWVPLQELRILQDFSMYIYIYSEHITHIYIYMVNHIYGTLPMDLPFFSLSGPERNDMLLCRCHAMLMRCPREHNSKQVFTSAAFASQTHTKIVDP